MSDENSKCDRCQTSPRSETKALTQDEFNRMRAAVDELKFTSHLMVDFSPVDYGRDKRWTCSYCWETSFDQPENIQHRESCSYALWLQHKEATDGMPKST